MYNLFVLILFNIIKDNKVFYCMIFGEEKLCDKMNIKKKNLMRSWIIVIKKRKKIKRKYILKKICVVKKLELIDCWSCVLGLFS